MFPNILKRLLIFSINNFLCLVHEGIKPIIDKKQTTVAAPKKDSENIFESKDSKTVLTTSETKSQTTDFAPVYNVAFPQCEFSKTYKFLTKKDTKPCGKTEGDHEACVNCQKIRHFLYI